MSKESTYLDYNTCSTNINDKKYQQNKGCLKVDSNKRYASNHDSIEDKTPNLCSQCRVQKTNCTEFGINPPGGEVAADSSQHPTVTEAQEEPELVELRYMLLDIEIFRGNKKEKVIQNDIQSKVIVQSKTTENNRKVRKLSKDENYKSQNMDQIPIKPKDEITYGKTRIDGNIKMI